MSRPKEINENGLPGRWVAFLNGEPVRRVGSNGNPMRDVPRWLDLDGLGLGDARQAAVDVTLYGDAYVDAKGHRVDPRGVVAYEPKAEVPAVESSK